MAPLSDLNTSNISYIAFWNPISEGYVDSVDPGEVTSDGNIVDYTEYDNGVHGTYDLSLAGNQDEVGFRVKDDGWFVIWKNRSKNFDTDSNEYLPGPWSVVRNWGDASGCGYGELKPGNAFEEAINSLASQLSNWGSIAYDPIQVGLANLETGVGTVSTLLSDYHYEGGYGDTSDSYRWFQYSKNIELLQAWHGATACWNYADRVRTYHESSESIGGETRWMIQGKANGVINLLAYGNNDVDLIPNPNTDYGTYFLGDNYAGDSAYSQPVSNILIQWE